MHGILFDLISILMISILTMPNRALKIFVALKKKSNRNRMTAYLWLHFSIF